MGIQKPLRDLVREVLKRRSNNITGMEKLRYAVAVILSLLVMNYNCFPLPDSSCQDQEEQLENPFASVNQCWKWMCNEKGEKYGVFVCTPPHPIDELMDLQKQRDDLTW